MTRGAAPASARSTRSRGTDQQCAVCHTADASGIAPIATVHAIYQRTAKPGIAFSAVAISGGTGANGTFILGDQPVISFQLADATGPIADAVTNPTYSITGIISGPTNDMQRVYAPIVSKSGLNFAAGAGTYSFRFPAWPANAQPPANVTDSSYPVRANPAGSYTLYFYVNKAFTDPKGVGQHDIASWVDTVKYLVDAPVQPRQVIAQAACDACHVDIQAHGGSRKMAMACSACHTQGALDKPIGSQGLPCVGNTDCPGFAPGWEQCQASFCTMTADPTPGTTIDFVALVHNIHFARLRESYSERNNLTPGAYGVVGSGDTLNDFSNILLPVDARNCEQCHTDSNAVCGTSATCGAGQSCSGGKCVNTAWQQPSQRACLTCHDSEGAFAHAQLTTFTPAAGAPIETCSVCHGSDAGSAFSVKAMHDVSSTVVPPLPRESL